MALPSDLIDLLAEFATAEVEYLLVGGHAVALHGHPRFTKDADLWLRDSPPNIAKAVSALRKFGAPATTIESLGPAAPLDVVWMGSAPARIDLMKAVPGGDFDRAWASRVQFDVGDAIVQVVGRAELAALKRASGRPQDILDAESLEASS